MSHKFSTAVPVVLGIILLATGVLKSHAAFFDLPVRLPHFSGRWGMVVVAEYEFLLGGWLISGFYHRYAVLSAAVTFICFFVFSAFAALEGEKTCGCFGGLNFSPWFAVTLDSLALLAITFYKPYGNNLHRNVPYFTKPAAALICLMVILPLAVAFRGPSSSPLFSPSKPTVDLGEVTQAQSRQLSLSVTSQRDYPIQISKIESTCPCLSLDCTPRLVPPFGDVEISGIFDLSREPLFTGKLRIYITITNVTNDALLTIQVSVTVKPRDIVQ